MNNLHIENAMNNLHIENRVAFSRGLSRIVDDSILELSGICFYIRYIDDKKNEWCQHAELLCSMNKNVSTSVTWTRGADNRGW